MASYEIREDQGNKYWPFQVYNLTEGKMLSDRFPSQEAAQKCIDQLSTIKINRSIFNASVNPQNTSTQPTEKPEPKEETEFIDGQHQVGDEIVDQDGNIYVAIQDSYYISAADVADIEDGWDATVTAGWHTSARLKSKSTQSIVEQVQAGQAKIVRRNGVTCVLFLDDQQTIPLHDLAYNQELGLYQKSKFPEVTNG